VTDPGELAHIFEADRETHLYGLPDLEEPFWSSSRWYRRRSGIVGRVSAGGGWVTGYAMSQRHPAETIELLTEVQDELPPGTWVTGPLGMNRRISTIRQTQPKGPHLRMILRRFLDVTEGRDVSVLTCDHAAELVDLHESDPGQSFFMPSLLDHGVFVGVHDQGKLVASAGTHVASDVYGIAAIGAVITHPAHRGRGLGRMVVAALCRELLPRFRTIGLNVAKSNSIAIRLYEELGFRTVFEYEETQLL
jgi:ribosomal protein S18 acetylase RimI-like enzyme